SNLETEIEFEGDKFTVADAILFKQKFYQMKEDLYDSFSPYTGKGQVSEFARHISGLTEEQIDKHIKAFRLIPVKTNEMKKMDEFLFYKKTRRRDRTEILHDILIVAKKGMLKTRIMYGVNLSWNVMDELLRFAKKAELIEEVEDPKHHWRKKPTMVWKTTDIGLKYAQDIILEFCEP
ncbi:unnamed protein product, partial [marine sediment metagenome]